MAAPPVAPLPTPAARRVARNIARPFAAQLAVRALTTAYFIAQVRLMAAPDQSDDLNQYTFAALLWTYASIITDWGLGTWLTREVAAHRADTDASHIVRRLFAETLGARFALAALGLLPLGVLALPGPGATLFHLTPAGSWSLLLLAFALLPNAFSSAVTALYNAYERLALPAGVQVVTALVNAALGVAALLLGWSAPGLAAAALLTNGATAAIFYRLLRRDFFAPRVAWQPAAVRRMLAQAFPLMLNGLLVFIFFRFDSVVIQLDRPHDVVVYEAAYKFINVTQIIAPAVVLALFPAMAHAALHDRPALIRHYRLAVKLLLLLGLPLVVATVALATPLITIITLGKGGYLPYSAWALAILICYLPLSFVNGVTQYVLIAVHRQARLAWAIGATALFNVGANLLAVPVFGIYGAAAVTVLSEIVLLVPFLRWAGRELGAPALRPGPSGVRLALAGAALALTTAGLSALGLAALPALAAGLLVYAAALAALRVLSPAEQALLRTVLRRGRG